jgi:hypothetical protein
MLLLLADFALATCPAPISPSEFARQLVVAESAYEADELAQFSAAYADARALVPCLDAAVSPAVASAWHRVAALAAFTANDESAAVAELRAVLALDPAWEISAAIAPPGNPNRQAYDAAKLAGPGASRNVRLRRGVTVVVDGSEASSNPSERPYILQILDVDRAVQSSALQPAGTGLPAHALEPAKRPALVIGAAGATVAAAGTYALALAFRASFDDPATPYSELDGLESTTNAAVIASAGLGAVAVGLGISAVVVKW